MLEERINVLIQSIDVLNVQMERLWDAKDEIEGRSAEISADPPKVKKAPKAKTEEGTVTRDELHKLCLAIVRDKPNAKSKIQKVLSKRLVKNLKDDELESIKAKLEKI